MRTTADIPFYLEPKLIPIHATFILVFLFFPYVYWLSLLFTLLLTLSVYVERYRRKLQSHLDVSFEQEDSILFKGERSHLFMSIDNAQLVNEMNGTIQLRLPYSDSYAVTHPSEEGSIIELKELPERLEFTIIGKKRGPVTMDELALLIRLPLRMGNMVVSIDSSLSWTVYPAIESQQTGKIRTLFNLGDRATNHSPIKDRSQQISSHPYTIEPSRQIDWFATAKRGSLQAKIYQPSAQDTFTLFLDLSAVNGPGLNHRFEDLIAQTALVSRMLIAEGGKLELFINKIDGNGKVTHLKIQEGAKQLKKILYLLSQLSDRDVYVPPARYKTYVQRFKNKQSQLVTISVS